MLHITFQKLMTTTFPPPPLHMLHTITENTINDNYSIKLKKLLGIYS